jgi:cytochrome c oxidase subunit 2
MILVDTAHLVMQTGLVPRGTRVEVFNSIFNVFLVLGTLVGIIVIGYMLKLGYEYRASADNEDARKVDDDRPRLGELPQGSGGGRKLALSFTLSAVVVVSLIVWTYATLLYVEGGAAAQTQEPLEVEVVGFQFGWKFTYPNGHQENGVLRVPVDRPVSLTVTSEDVFHNFGAPGLRVKTDAIPGQTTETWFMADETGSYEANCYELCGTGHSAMVGEVRVLPADEFESWYAGTNGTDSSTDLDASRALTGSGVPA